MAAAEENVIDVNRLTRKFGDFLAVDQVSFRVRKGEIFGFLGANGAGKTTLIKMLIGLLRPSSGTALINGYDLYKHAEKIKKQIGYMSQKFSLYEDLTAKENIELFGGIYGLGFKRIRDRMAVILNQLGLAAEKDSLIRDLPVGWRQKLAFSVAVIHEPAIVYLDEPTSGVDPVTSRQFWALIHEAARRGTTLFLTTHNMVEAEYCDRIAMMVAGKLVECDSPAVLKAKYDAVDMDEVFVKVATQYPS
jgi:ABC-2 type transport system ATP-binding protein